MTGTARKWLAGALAAALCCSAATAHAGAQVIRIATLAPEGSSWMKLFHQWAGAIEKRAPRLQFKFYAGGIAGDEKDAVRKMRLKSLDGSAVTAIGLGLIQPQVRALEIPFLVKSYAELDWVREQLDGELRKMFEDKDYVLLFWGDVGQVQLFTNIPIADDDKGKGIDKLGQMKIWAWSDDPMVRKLFSQVKLNAVPMGVPDVLPALQTGTIDACYGSTLSTLALQWNTKVKYVTSMIIGQAIGATVVTKATWSSLSPDEKKMVQEESKKLGPQLLKTIRADNVRSLTKMKSLGLQEIPTPRSVIDRFTSEAATTAQALDGQLYTKDFRLRVADLVAKCPPDRCKK